MRTRHLIVGLMLSTLAFAAQAKHRHLDYAAYAGEPIAEFHYTQLYNWQHTGDHAVVVWTKPTKAYLLTLRNNCSALAGEYHIEIGGVDGIETRVRAGTDNVRVGQLRCRIDAIQPLDLARMKSERV